MKDSPYIKRISYQKVGLWKNKKKFFNTLDLELTERCNCNCIHCCINQPAADKKIITAELNSKDFESILSQAADLGCLTVRFTGAEPLIRKDFKKLYLYARKIGLKVIIFTNGTLITPDLVKLLTKVPPMEKIEITLYGMEKKSYEGVTRTAGSFAAARQGIDLLLQNKIPFVVKGALLPPNINEIEIFDQWVKTNIPWMEDLPGHAVFFDLRWRHDSKKKNKAIKALRLEPDKALNYIARNEPQYSNDLKEFCGTFSFPPGKKLFTCVAGKTQAAVDSYGMMQLCQPLRHPETIFNLKKGSMKEGLNSFFPKIRNIQAKNPDYLNRCAKCFLKGLCEMCPAKSWIEHGTIDTPVEYLCKVAHTSARYLGYLSDNEHGWEIRDWKARISKANSKHTLR